MDSGPQNGEEGQDERRIILAHIAPPHRPRLLWALLRRTRRRCLHGYRGARYVSSSLAEELSFGGALHLGGARCRSPRRARGHLGGGAFLAKACAVICIVIALTAISPRGPSHSAAASCALETRSLQTSIETARAEGNELEVSQSVLANPSRIKAQATALGMAAPAPVQRADHAVSDIVATDGAGSLSLSESVARMRALIPMERYRYPDKSGRGGVPMPRPHRARPRTLLRRAPARLLAHGPGPRPPRGSRLCRRQPVGRPSGRAGALARPAPAWAPPSTRPCRRSPGAPGAAAGFRGHSGRVLPALGVSAPGHRIR